MDDSNNLNPNDNQNNNIQGPNPYTNMGMGFDPNDPYASLNPTPFNPNMDFNNYPNPDAVSGMDSNVNQSTNSNNVENVPQNSDIQNPSVQEDDLDSIENLTNNVSFEQGNANSLDNQTINPILNQNISNDNSYVPNTDYQNNNSNMNYQDNSSNVNMGYEQNNFDNSAMNYQDSSSNANMSYGQNDFVNPNMNNSSNTNMGYEQNNFVNPNMNYQDNSSNINMGYEQNNFDNSNMNYQNNSSNIGYEQNNFDNSTINNEVNQVQDTISADANDYNNTFVKTWMGDLYEKAHSKKFNWSAAILGGIYFLYRKMYLTGILFAVLQIFLVSLFTFLIAKIGVVSLVLSFIAYIAFILIYGFSFYPLYRNFVHSKLKKYKQTTTDNSQLLNIARTKGNTSVVAVILYCIIMPIILGIIYSILFTVGLINLGNSLLNNLSDDNYNETSIEDDIPDTDIQLFNFKDDYLLEYDSNVWYLDEEYNTLTKGDYSLLYAQTISNISNLFNVDVSTPSGRSTLLGTLLNSLETQAAARNLSVEAGVSNFVMGTNAYYGYIDVIATSSISRYYLILLPDDNLLFQFVLSVNDTTIDYETNLEVINILTSVYADESIETNSDNTLEENIVENDVVETNTIDEENVIDDESNTTSEEDEDNIVANDTVTENVSNVSSSLSDVLN